jgi:hypothetical protein
VLEEFPKTALNASTHEILTVPTVRERSATTGNKITSMPISLAAEK